jgi:polyhydroxybutyrate depolymerase
LTAGQSFLLGLISGALIVGRRGSKKLNRSARRSARPTASLAHRFNAKTVPPSAEGVRLITVGLLSRSYVLHLPSDMGGRSLPLIVGFHGGGATPWGFEAVTRLAEEAVRMGFVVAYPIGYKRSWSGGDFGGRAHRDGVDDLDFIAHLLDDLSAHVSIDPRRIYAVGWSSGGKFTLRLACEMAERIAAIAVVGSGLGTDQIPVRPVTLILLHGTADTFHPFYGGEGGHPVAIGVQQVGAPETARRWSEFNGCSERTEVTYRKGSATASTYVGCRPDAEVVLFTIEGMGHQWPGHTIDVNSPGLPDWMSQLGPGTDDVDATAEILRFFDSHPSGRKSKGARVG